MTELLRFFANDSDYVIVYDDVREMAFLVGLDEDYSCRFHDDLDPITTIIDTIFELGIEEIYSIEETFRQAIFEELKEQHNLAQLEQFENLIKEVG